ncbi:MAG: UDP-3-O-(3-hydroxymyristoyl)glucosamine N-acyltransferase [Pseudomonadales bacterium]|nr:UDP-3-O-(3-hydroxymyristoyl)glucosamine N-acyltransferase [Pseudomonadales bacterium]
MKLSSIQQAFPELISAHLGADAEIQRIYSIEGAQACDLIFVSSKEFIEPALKSVAIGVITTKELAEKFLSKKGIGVLIANNVLLAHATIKQAYSDRDFINEQWGSVHQSAIVHETARIAKDVFISPNVTIGQKVVIGKRSRILAGVVIEEGAHIGEDCIIRPNAVIGYDCVIKNFVDIGAGTVIGSEGFGFAQDEKRKSFRIPQTGNVVIEDHVRIGANNCIDRATYKSTRIGAGTKTDNLCHFAHNVEIGEDCLLTSMFCIAGTSKLGDRVIASGQTGIVDHVNVCSDTVLLHRAGVTKDITEPGFYAGLPLQPLVHYMKNSIQLRKLYAFCKSLKNNQGVENR